MIDKEKFGEALALVMDRLDALELQGELEGFEITDVLVVAGFVRPFPREGYPDRVESLILVDGTTQVPYVQHGLLTLGADVVLHVDGDDE